MLAWASAMMSFFLSDFSQLLTPLRTTTHAKRFELRESGQDGYQANTS